MRFKSIFLGFLLLLAILFALIGCLWSGKYTEWIFFALEGWIILLLGFCSISIAVSSNRFIRWEMVWTY